MKTLLVDGNNILARADFAAKGKHVEMSVGEVNTAALVIFINMLSRYVRLVEPTHMAVFWDAGHEMRDAIYPAYKAARKKPVEGSGDTIPFAQAKEFLTWAGVPHKAHRGWEADDLIAVTARGSRFEVVILSGDKDLLQLVTDEGDRSVTQIRPPDDTFWDEAMVEEKFGVPPHHLASYLALVGDPGDGVPGLRGVGPKKACALLEKVSWDWEALLEEIGQEMAAEARLMRSLVDLRTLDYPQSIMLTNAGAPTFEPTAPGDSWSWTALQDFCHRYRLKSVLERLESGTLWSGAEGTKPSTDGLFDNLDTGDTQGRSA